mmetsp:Transcript_39382/g.111522  ORF Transcript_39382/g.111522 Transcript_39382/m.111522 type:complete len:200 (+) Transcript_39382:76-675(+)
MLCQPASFAAPAGPRNCPHSGTALGEKAPPHRRLLARAVGDGDLHPSRRAGEACHGVRGPQQALREEAREPFGRAAAREVGEHDDVVLRKFEPAATAARNDDLPSRTRELDIPRQQNTLMEALALRAQCHPQSLCVEACRGAVADSDLRCEGRAQELDAVAGAGREAHAAEAEGRALQRDLHLRGGPGPRTAGASHRQS